MHPIIDGCEADQKHMCKVGIVGLHALPNNHGGYEQYFSYLLDNEMFNRFAARNRIIFYCEDNREHAPENVRIDAITPTKGQAGVKYYLNAVSRAAKECDFIYCCGTGASIGLLREYFVIRRRRIRIAINVDGEEHKRTKYSAIQRIGVLALHIISMALADVVIIDSKALAGRLPLTRLFRNKLTYVPYFFPKQLKHTIGDQRYGGTAPFDLVVARLVPENNIELIIQAKLENTDKTPLHIVGGTDNPYGKALREKYGQKVVFLGGIYDQDKLNELRRNCRYYLHGHSVGGTNPSLVEALGFCQTILCYDTVYNRETASNSAQYFKSLTELKNLLSSTIQPTNQGRCRISAYDEDDAVKMLIACISVNLDVAKQDCPS